uniref:guanylate cyclase n=1 Tax=Romanomermis culicivorax TaxID=13658 RepID=A0A915L4W0_ROMCU
MGNIIGTVIVIALIGAITGGGYYYKKQQYEAALFQSLWKVDMKYFQYVSHKDKSIRSQVESVNLESQSTNLNGSVKADGIFEPSRNGNSATAVGSFKGTLCIARRGEKSGRITLSMAQRNIFVVLKTMKEINHDNLNVFVGLSVEEEEYFYTLWTYCPRGSLDNVLFNSEIRIDETFQVSLIRDIISGLAFLHDSLIGCHGRLFAKNCVVDGRWVAKISEFGIFHLMQEFLDQKAVLPDSEPTNNEILSQLKTLDFNGRPLRPILKQVQGFDLKFLNLLEMGWRENPITRPTSSSLKKEIFLQTQK